MKMVLVPDSFKGTLSSVQVMDGVEKAARRHFSNLEVIRIPMADGGEGTLDALMAVMKGAFRELEVMGPLPGMRVKARYGIIHHRTAVIEMAQASGLTLLEPGQRNPLHTTTYGTGELFRAALDEEIRDFIVAIGGSATNDGGMGFSEALGVSFKDELGQPVGHGGRNLGCIHTIDISHRDARIDDCRITVMCDVDNPLTGERGATAVYGPQKGVTPEIFPVLENGMKHYARLINDLTDKEVNTMPGAGAAGGLGAALIAFFGAALKAGVDTILDYTGFDELIEHADLVITGEGRIDVQSLYGKVPVGVARRCQRKNVPVIVLAGSMGEKAQEAYAMGVSSIMTAVNGAMTLEEAMNHSEELLADAADRMFRMIKTGMALSGKGVT